MSSENPQNTPENSLFDPDQVPRLKRTVHPDSLKFIEMAKDLLDNPAIQQAIQNEKQRQGTNE